MSIYSLFDSNEKAEINGFMYTVQDGAIEISFLLARAGGANKQFTKKMAEALRPHQHAMNAGSLDEDLMIKLQIDVMSETLVLDWANLATRDGEEIDYSKEECVKLLTALPALRDLLFEQCNNRANFAHEEREESAKS
ncbi:MAG TPA: hypothetical protein EYF98_16145 [Planctomycetes bacterium]|jgi:hypothetical protein|nr:hypothetical protein [Planctomycetota bacterium]